MPLDGEAGTPTQEHSYVAAMSEPWGLCQVCGLAEASHLRSRGVYTPTTSAFRCPTCVTARDCGEPMPHAPGGCPR
jgi:hypothetical protein